MDFFSSAAQHPSELAPEGFAKAVNERFTPQLLPSFTLPTLPPSRLPAAAPLPNPSLSSNPQPIPPADLHAFLARPSTLILDIRSHHAYSTARITGAISLSAPSTLLKRPLFTTQRLTAMLSSHSARAKFAAWADHENIIVYDADTTLIKSPCNISGLLQKFRNEGYSGNLAYVSGGFQSVWKERRDLVITTKPQDEEDEDEISPRPSFSGHMPITSNGKRSPPLRTKRLPPSAFSAVSTTMSMRSPSQALSGRSTDAAYPGPTLATNPFYDSIRQNVELSHGVTERIPLRLPRRVRSRLSDLPFTWLRNIAQHAGPNLDSPTGEESGQETNGSVQHPEEMSQTTHDEGTEALALQFYKIELSEQRRLQAVMDHHSKESGVVEGVRPPSEFPYSIAAGVEKGTKNRYRHIWPFEHSRVRLQAQLPSSVDQDDYVNASYVQPLCTRKRYIATQGPLDATFVDFWTLIWQQNVHVIVMLTREVEGSLTKCGRYWMDGAYGPLSLQLVSESGDLEHEREKDISGSHSTFFSDFAAQTRQRQRQPPKFNRTIKREFILRHTGYPHAGARKVVQLQYLGWPDMTVPDDPRGILQLIKDTDTAVKETNLDETSRAFRHYGEYLDPETGVWGRTLSNPPILLHCSAGVGRTGGFIAVDAILDAIRRELRQASSSDGGDTSRYVSRPESEAMDLDNPSPENPLGSPTGSDTPDIKTRKWVERISEMADNERPFNPNKPMPTSARPLTLASAFQHSHPLYDPPRPPTLAYHGFPSLSSKDSAHRSELHLSKLRTLPPDISNSMNHDRLRTFSAPSNGSSGLALGHHPPLFNAPSDQPKLSGVPMALSPSPLRVAQGYGPSLLVASTSISSSTGEVPESSSDFSAVSSRSASPFAPMVSTSGTATSPEPTNGRYKGLKPQRIEASISLPELPLSFSQTEHVTPHAEATSESKTSGSLNYTSPRKLHIHTQEIPSLCSFEDPIMTVLLDMREQRMSLCQSLRQYVFVHATVVEGALQIIDEERLKGTKTPVGAVLSNRSNPKDSTMHQLSSSPSASSTMGTTSTGKRVASPTELPMEDKEGGVRLTKRPSVKRKSDEGEKYHLGLQLPDSPPSRTPQPAPSLASLHEGFSDT